MTDDVVSLAPNTPPIIGKEALRPWLTGYVEAFETHWDKPVQEFVVSGEWAFERYSYTSTDMPRGGGNTVQGTGWGLAIYHLDADGVYGVGAIRSSEMRGCMAGMGQATEGRSWTHL